jgi:hypothetical protein
MNTGDIILFKGEGLLSALIMALPSAKYSHVGLYVDHPAFGPCVFESTSIGTLPDVITGEPINGVQLTSFEERVGGYEGEVFPRPILGQRTQEQLDRLLVFIRQHHGTAYEKDNLQLARAELDIFPWQQNDPDPSSLFCSETVVMALREAGLIVNDGSPANEATPTDCSDEYLTQATGFTFGEITELKG